jgi:hypothetical protein
MVLTTFWCCLLQRDVFRVTNLEDDGVAVVCPDFRASTGLCHLKTSALQEMRLLEFHGHGPQDLIDSPAARCRFA